MTDYSQLVKRLRAQIDTQIEDDIQYVQTSDDLMGQAADAIEALQARVAELEADNLRLSTNLHRFPALMKSIEQQKNEPLSSREMELIEAIRSLPESFAEYQWKADERQMFGEKYVRSVDGDNGKGRGRQWIATTPPHIDGLARYIAAANPDTVAMLLSELYDARALLERKSS